MQLLPKKTNKPGHYSPGVIMNNLLYVSGQLPINPANGQVVHGDVVAQLQQALANVDAVLQQAGTTRERVGLCRVYLSDITLWNTVNDAYAEFFGDHMPARVIVPTRELHYGAMVEVEAVAELK